MATFLFANNAQTTLAGPISNSATTLNVAAGSGVLFPQPGNGQYFAMTLLDAATRTVREIVYVTAVSGDTFTVTRGQENFSAGTWNAGDIAANLPTAGTLRAFAQSANLASSFYQGVAGGTANALTVDATVPSNLAPQNGQIFVVTKNATDNTDAVTLTIPTTGGVSRSVVYADGSSIGPSGWSANAAAILYCTGGVYQFMGILSAPGQTVITAADAGSSSAPNDIVITATSPASGLTIANGKLYYVTKNAYGNTDAMTFKTNAGAIGLQKLSGTPMYGGDWPANTPMLISIQTIGGQQRALALTAPRLNISGHPSADETAATNDQIVYYDASEVRNVKRDLLSFALNLSALAPSTSPPHNIYSQTTAGTYTFVVPPNTYWVYGTVVGAGAGGSGGGGGSSNGGGGGGAGGSAFGWIAVTPGQAITVVVGAGGAGSSAPNTQGNNGGTSSAAGLTGVGGYGGLNLASAPAGGTGGTASGGQIQQIGGAGGDGVASANNIGGGAGGASSQGGGGRTATTGHNSSTVADGRASGSGGGGIYGQASGYQTGGFGADGCVYILY